MNIVVNDKRWQENSDGWVRAMHASNERKQRKKEMANLVGYKVEIIFTQDKENDDPADWILDAVNEGQFKLNTKNIHTTSVAPIDMESDEYKWLRDANKA